MKATHLLAVVILFLTTFLTTLQTTFSQTSENVWEADVEGMSCPLCSKNIDRQLHKLQGVTKAIESAGFTVSKVQEKK